MRIEFEKKIPKRAIEVACEIDYYKKSPYIDLLKDIKTVRDLENKLSKYGAPEAAIKNLKKNFEALGVIQGDVICDLSSGFPEQEYGKYKITYLENETSIPFQFKKFSITRERPGSSYIENINQISFELLNVLKSKDHAISDENFRLVNPTENLRGIQKDDGNETVTIYSNDGKSWKYKINQKEFEMTSLDMNEIFKGSWNEEEEKIVMNFSYLQQYFPDSLKSFFISYSEENIGITSLGKIQKAKYTDIPIMPDKESYKEWFHYIFKLELESMKRYFTVEELEQIWKNIWYTTPSISSFFEYPEFEFSDIKKKYTKDEEFYWLLNGGNDLNPYKDRIKRSGNVLETMQDFIDKIGLKENSELLVIDRYVNTIRHFHSLETLILLAEKKYKVSIITQQPYMQSENDKKRINELKQKYNINVIIKDKHKIPHDRLWRVGQSWYTVSKSIDFIISRGNITDTTISPVFVTQIENNEARTEINAADPSILEELK